MTKTQPEDTPQSNKGGRPPNAEGPTTRITMRLDGVELDALDRYVASLGDDANRSSIAAGIVVGYLVDEGLLPEGHGTE